MWCCSGDGGDGGGGGGGGDYYHIVLLCRVPPRVESAKIAAVNKILNTDLSTALMLSHSLSLSLSLTLSLFVSRHFVCPQFHTGPVGSDHYHTPSLPLRCVTSNYQDLCG